MLIAASVSNGSFESRPDPGDGMTLPMGSTTPGVRIAVGPVMSVFACFQTRLYERVNGIQVTAPHHLMIGTNYGF